MDIAEVGAEPSENEANASNNSWLWPVEGCDTVTSMFGKRVHPISGTTTESDHICISGDNADGAKVYAALAGTVLETGFEAEQGNYIIITHENGIETSYRHLKEILVMDGDPVAAGDTIGTVGKTGDATGPCLAFCVYVNGVAADPLEYYQ
jgi:murein DD-endopeptidase MepM/ murein hydrolase activator NlpD